MDLLSKRYASPCFFLNGVIQTGRFEEFVEDFMQITNEEREERALWEFFLHRAPMYEGSFDDFKAEIKNNEDHKNLSDTTIETTVKQTMNILNKFNPEKGGE